MAKLLRTHGTSLVLDLVKLLLVARVASGALQGKVLPDQRVTVLAKPPPGSCPALTEAVGGWVYSR